MWGGGGGGAYMCAVSSLSACVHAARRAYVSQCILYDNPIITVPFK